MRTNGWLYGLRDPLDSWTGEDKLAHLFGAADLWAVMAARFGTWEAWIAVVAVGLLVEIVEVIRYRAWVAKGRPGLWPFLCDRVSLKDLAVDVLGAALMALALRGHP